MTALADVPVQVDDVVYTHRWCAENGLIHSYSRAELADSRVEYLIPRCSGTMYPVRHARIELSCAVTRNVDRFTWCLGCAAAARRCRLGTRRRS